MNKPDKIFDGLLVLQFKTGDQKAFGLLVKRWNLKLCNQAFWYTNDADIAQDIVQESWTIIFKKINGLQEPNNFGSWALKIVSRKAIDWLRKNKREALNLNEYLNYRTNYDTPEYDENIDYDTNLNLDNSTKIIINGIKNLPKNQQIVLQLFYMQEYSLREIAEILSLSTGTVKSRLFYAREKLKQILKNRSHEK